MKGKPEKWLDSIKTGTVMGVAMSGLLIVVQIIWTRFDAGRTNPFYFSFL